VKDIEAVGKTIVDAAVKVHKALGPGLLESAYQQCLAYELSQRGLTVATEVQMPVCYDGLTLDAGYRIDMLVESCVVVENKAVVELAPVHTAQILTYMKLGDFPLGYLINWNVPLIKDGIHRVVNHLPEPSWRSFP
jgi:GxxExxY protein